MPATIRHNATTQEALWPFNGEHNTMTTSITLTFRWPMGHRILGLTGAGAKCRNIHGHNWQADVELPNDDRSLEFGMVKQLIGDWIEDRLDHGFLLAIDDPFKDYLIENRLKFRAIPCQPDTEAIAEMLGQISYELLGVQPMSVHVLEGYRNAATWTPR